MIEPDAVPTYVLCAVGLGITVTLTMAMHFIVAPALLLPLWIWPFVAVSAMLLRRVGHSKIAGGLEGTAMIYGQGLGFLFLLFPLSALSLHFADPSLSRIDRALGFDWAAYTEALKPANPQLRLAYRSLEWQPALATVALCCSGMESRMWKFVFASAVALAIAVAIFPFAPAVGPGVYYGFVPLHQTSLGFGEVIQILKDGQRLVSKDYFVGFISFPSYHAACAVLLVWAVWPIRWLRWLMLTLNLVMLAATPIFGNHYLVDIIGGFVIAAVSIMISQRLFGTLRNARA